MFSKIDSTLALKIQMKILIKAQIKMKKMKIFHRSRKDNLKILNLNKKKSSNKSNQKQQSNNRISYST